jgi:transposase-like protein
LGPCGSAIGALVPSVITIDDERIKSHLDRVVRGSVEETLNALLDAEADRLCNAQRYERSAARRQESSVEEALIEMYLAGISVRRVEDITEALWSTRVSPSTVSNLNKKIYAKIEA